MIVSVLVLLYQACLPGGLTLDPAARSLELSLFPTEFSRADFLGNLIPYWIFGHFVFAASWRSHGRAGRASLATLGGTVAMVLAVEGVEWFNLQRGSALLDVVAGAAGAGLAVASGGLYMTRCADGVARWLRREAVGDPLKLAAVAMAAFILLDVARPFHVISSADYLFDNLKRSNVIPLRQPGDDLRDQLGLELGSRVGGALLPRARTADYLAAQAERGLAYLALFGLLAFASRAPALWRRLAFGGAVVAAAELVSLVIVGGRFDVTYLLSGLAAALLAAVATRTLVRRPGTALLALAGVTTAYIVVSDLRPFVFAPPDGLSPMQLVPLIHHFRDIQVSQLFNIVEAAWVALPPAAAVYGLLLWATPRRRVLRWPPAAPAVLYCGAVAASMELAQIWLPAREAHLEDVLFAMAGGLLGVWLARSLVAGTGEVATVVTGTTAAPRRSAGRPRPGHARRPHAPTRLRRALRIVAESPSLREQLPAEGLVVKELPLRIGRLPASHEKAPSRTVHLQLEDSHPFELSRNHCAIVRERGELVLRDNGSYWGTEVNGVRVGGAGSRAPRATLEPGYNRIVAGSPESRFRFAVVVAGEDDAAAREERRDASLAWFPDDSDEQVSRHTGEPGEDREARMPARR